MEFITNLLSGIFEFVKSILKVAGVPNADELVNPFAQA